jgi:DNA-directed RNA polymerase subunit beta
MSKRINFGKLKEVIQPPNLIENQIDSFTEFLQMDLAPTQRKQVGLEAVFSEVFPIESYDSRCHLEYVSYTATPPRETEIEAIREGVTYSVSLYVKLRLREEDHIKDEEIYMGELPMISERQRQGTACLPYYSRPWHLARSTVRSERSSVCLPRSSSSSS